MDDWVSIPLSKLSEDETEVTYPLKNLLERKEEIKIFIRLVKSKMGRLVHIYPRLLFINLTPYKITLYSALYGVQFSVNKRLPT